MVYQFTRQECLGGPYQVILQSYQKWFPEQSMTNYSTLLFIMFITGNHVGSEITLGVMFCIINQKISIIQLPASANKSHLSRRI